MHNLTRGFAVQCRKSPLHHGLCQLVAPMFIFLICVRLNIKMWMSDHGFFWAQKSLLRIIRLCSSLPGVVAIWVPQVYKNQPASNHGRYIGPPAKHHLDGVLRAGDKSPIFQMAFCWWADSSLILRAYWAATASLYYLAFTVMCSVSGQVAQFSNKVLG